MDGLLTFLLEVLDALSFGWLSGAGQRRAARQRAADERDRQLAIRARAALVGLDGVTVTKLRPSGRVSVGGIEYEALAEGAVLEPGMAVRVVGVSPFSLTVRAADAGLGYPSQAG